MRTSGPLVALVAGAILLGRFAPVVAQEDTVSVIGGDTVVHRPTCAVLKGRETISIAVRDLGSRATACEACKPDLTRRTAPPGELGSVPLPAMPAAPPATPVPSAGARVPEPAPAATPALTDAEVDEAIRLGLSGKGDVGVLRTGAFSNSFGVVITGPYGRVVSEAANARDDKRPYGRADVEPGILRPFWQVLVNPTAADIVASGRMEARSLYLQAKVPKGAPAPARIEPVYQATAPCQVVLLSGPGGGYRRYHQSQCAIGYFEPAQVPAGDVEIVASIWVGSPGTGHTPKTKEERTTIKLKDRARIR